MISKYGVRRLWRMLLLGGFAIVAAQCPTTAHACFCVPPPTHAERMNQASAVFAGKLLFITPPGGKPAPAPARRLEWTRTFPFIRFSRPFPNFGGIPRLTFQVTEVWKGPLQRQIVFESVVQEGGSCGYWWEEGKEYLVYVPDNEAGVRTALCTGTTPLEEARDQLAILGAGWRPQAGNEGSRSPVFLAMLVLAAGVLVLVVTFIRRWRSRPLP